MLKDFYHERQTLNYFTFCTSITASIKRYVFLWVPLVNPPFFNIKYISSFISIASPIYFFKTEWGNLFKYRQNLFQMNSILNRSHDLPHWLVLIPQGDILQWTLLGLLGKFPKLMLHGMTSGVRYLILVYRKLVWLRPLILNTFVYCKCIKMTW